jgi:hypothetical protein
MPAPIRMPGISWRKRRNMQSFTRVLLDWSQERTGSPHRCATRSPHTVFTAPSATSHRQTS